MKYSVLSRLGGHFLFGDPNICSLHNRSLLLIENSLRDTKFCSAHVRPFFQGQSTPAFLERVFSGWLSAHAVSGERRVFPFPRGAARMLANAWGTFTLTIFFFPLRSEKQKELHPEFSPGSFPGAGSARNKLLNSEYPHCI